MRMATAGGKNPSKSSKAKAKKIVLLLAIVVLAVALFFIGAVVFKYVRGNKDVELAQGLYNPSNSSTDIWSQPEEERNNLGITKDFFKLHELNEDTIGWLSIPKTKLDLPVALGDDNIYYLDRNIEKKSNAFGVPFADYRNVIIEDYQSTNITIYGHAAKDGSYFSAVKNYKDVNFYKEHPSLSFNTIYGKGEYKIIGAFMEDVRPSNPKRFNYHDQIDMNAEQITTFVDNVKKRSYFTTDVDVQDGDKFVTLSTCDTEIDSSANTPYRMVLVARRVRDGENTSINVNAAKSNTSMIMPDGWVSKKGKANPYK